MNAPESSLPPADARVSGLSYKFQRLREGIRQAVASGELQDKLPGERVLAQRFGANAKTLSKALTDLAAEGILERRIGLGTFVKGRRPDSTRQGRWLLITDGEEADSALGNAIRAINFSTETVHGVCGLRPSFLSQFSAVIDMSPDTPDSFLREMTVRNVPVVLLNREPATLSAHAVVIDQSLAGDRLAQKLLLAGHRKFATIERNNILANAIRQTAARHEAIVSVATCQAEQIIAMIDSGTTAALCDSPAAAIAVRGACNLAGIEIPAQLSLAAVGCRDGIAPCSGYFADPRDLVQAAAELLKDASLTRPAALWINGQWHDAATIGAVKPIRDMQDSAMRLEIAV